MGFSKGGPRGIHRDYEWIAGVFIRVYAGIVLRNAHPHRCSFIGFKVLLGLYMDNGKENGNYRGYRGYIGVINHL